MAVDIILKKGRGVPPAESLSLGELAVDDATGIVYTLLVSGEVVPVNQAAIDSKAVLDISDSAPLGVEDGYLWLNSLNGLVYIYDRDAGWFQFPNSGGGTGGGGDGIPEAPMSGGPYGRKSGGWVEIIGGDGNVDLTGYATETWVTEQGYLTDFTESDPTVPDHVKEITEQDIATWNAGGSGVAGVITFNNRSGAVTLTAEDVEAVYSYTEADPTVPQHVKDITEEDIANWNSGTGGGGGGDSYWVKGDVLSPSLEKIAANYSLDAFSTARVFYASIENETVQLFVDKAEVTGTVQAADYLDAEGNSILGDSVSRDERISDDQINNWDAAYSWGDHSTVGYLTSDSLDGYATQTWVENQNYLTSVDLNEYATQTWVENQNYLTEFEESDPTVPQHVKNISQSDINNWNAGSSVDLSGYATESWVSSNYQVKGSYATESWVSSNYQVKGSYLTSSSLNGYATETWVSNNYQVKGSYLTSSSLNGYATQTWVNNKGYVTSSHEHPASKITTGTFKSGTYRFPGALTAVGDITAYYSSDQRLKKDLEPLEGMAAVSKLNGYRFNWDDDKCEELEMEQRGKDVGVIAQEVMEVLPEVCVVRDSGYIGVRYDKLVPTLIQAINELQAQIDELKGAK